MQCGGNYKRDGMLKMTETRLCILFGLGFTLGGREELSEVIKVIKEESIRFMF